MPAMHLIAILYTLFCGTLGADSNAWKSRNIYFALTDRFARTGGAAASACDNLGHYCGGTFAGLRSKLDYIKGMGFDAIWITPVVTNSPGGYHGYWAQDLYSINPYYGSSEDLKALVNAAHTEGIYVMVDVVANHMGQGAIHGNNPSPMNQDSAYHPACDIDWNDQVSVRQCRLANLPDVYTEKTEIRIFYQNWIKWLVQTYGFDGIRVDTVKHVEKEFWPGFVTAAGVYAIGEVTGGDPGYLSSFASVMPGLLNYPIYYSLTRVFQQTSSFQDLVDTHDQISQMFPDPALLGTFIDNHDQSRFLHVKNDISLLKNGLAYVILAQGIPIIYYGTEQAYAGGNDPMNREDLWHSGYKTNSDLYEFISQLSATRKTAGGLAGNDHIHLYVSHNAYVWSRANGKIIVVTTNSGGGSSDSYCFVSGQPSSTQYHNILGSNSYIVDGNGNICVTHSNGQPIVLVKASISLLTDVAIAFNEKLTTSVGNAVKVVGSIAQFDNQNPSDEPTLSAEIFSGSNPLWKDAVNIQAGQTFSYKHVKMTSSSTTIWESNPERSYSTLLCPSSTISTDPQR